MDRGRAGCPACLDYCSVLEAVKLACDRSALLARLQRDGQSYPPSVPWLTAALKEEWAALPELHAHLRYVEAPVQSTVLKQSPSATDGNWMAGSRDKGHEGMGPSDFLEEAPARRAGLTGPEVLALRLYAGPGHAALDRSLRAHSGRFPATQFCLDAAIGKLAQVNPTAEEPLFWPMRAEMPGGWLRRYHQYRGIAHKRLALSDPAPVSSSLQLDPDPDCLFFELHPTELDADKHFLAKAADVQWLAQSSGCEMLLPSNTIFVPQLQTLTCREARELAPQFVPYYPWDFERNLPLVTADYLPLANALLQLVHQAEGRRLDGEELLELSVEGLPTSPSGVTEGPRPSALLVPFDIRRESLGWKMLAEEGIPETQRRLSQLSGPGRRASVASSGQGRRPSAAFAQGRRPSATLRRPSAPRRGTLVGALRRPSVLPRRSLAPDQLPLATPEPPGGGTDAVRLAKLRLYTARDVAQLEQRGPLKPSLNDGLEAGHLAGLPTDAYPHPVSVAHAYPGSGWEPRWWEWQCWAPATQVAVGVAVGLAAVSGLGLGLALPFVLSPKMVNRLALQEFNSSQLMDQIIVRFPRAPTNLTCLSQLAGTEVLSVRHSSVGYVLRLAQAHTEAELQAVVANLKASGVVVSAEPDIKVEFGRVPTDPLWYLQWAPGPNQQAPYGIRATAAWDTTTGSSSIIVAVTDTGVLPHADLQDRLLPGYDMISDLTIANDGDGRDADPSDPGDSTNPAKPSSWHGTFCSGIVAGVPNNGIGIAGMAWNAKILPVRCLGVGGGYLSDWADAARWAAGLSVAGVPLNPNKAHVVSASLGTQVACPGWLQGAINDVVAAGVTIVVAAGNNAADAGGAAPAGCQNVITVAAHGPSGAIAYYSNRGPRVDVMAPGGDFASGSTGDGVVSTTNSGTTYPVADAYGFSQGTSFATPYVSGLVALMLSVDPALRPGMVRDIVRRTAHPFVDAACTTSICGAGLADAAAALQFVQQATLTPTPTVVFKPNRDVAGCHPVLFVLKGGNWASDMGWTVKEALPVFAVPSNSYATGQTYTYTLCFRRGNYTFEALDSYGDGWTGGTFAISLAGALLASGTLESGFVQDFPFTVLGTTVTTTLTTTSTHTATPTKTSSATQSPTRTSSRSLSATPTRTTTPSPTRTHTRSPTSSVTRTATQSTTHTQTGSSDSTPTPLMTASPTPTQTGTASATRTRTPTRTRSRSATPSLTHTLTATASQTLTRSITRSLSHTPTPTRTKAPPPTSTPTSSTTASASRTPAKVPTGTPSGTSSRTSTPTGSSSGTVTQTATRPPTLSLTATFSNTMTRPRTPTPSPTATPTRTGTPSATRTSTGSSTASGSRTVSASPSRTTTSPRTVTRPSWSPTASPTRTLPRTSTPTATVTPPKSGSPTETQTETSTSTGTDTATSTSSVTVAVCQW